jgi:putative membrane protein
MHTIALVLAGLVGLFHVWIFVLEAALWTKPIGMRTFRNTPEKAEATKVFAVNQGVYNAFLAAGIFWGLAAGGA